MLTVNHVLTGAVVGEFIGDPLLAFILALLLHLLLDKVPHFWPNEEAGKTVVFLVDILACFLVLVFLFTRIAFSKSMFWGALGGFSVDAVLLPLLPFNIKLGHWHSDRQIHKTDPIHLFTDGILALICVSVLMLKWV